MKIATEILDAVVRGIEAGRGVALCAIVATRGSTPQPAGTMVCVDEAAQMTGTLGGGCVEADVRRRAHQLLSAGRSELITFSLDSDFGFDDGMICGGQMDVAVSVLSPSSDPEPYRKAFGELKEGRAAAVPLCVEAAEGSVQYRIHVEAAPRLLIAGAGHISRVLAGMMVRMGFSVHVIDDRADYANPDRFPPPIDPVTGDIAKTLCDWPVDHNTYVVIVTRGHRHDEQALRSVLGSTAKYIGMIGSRRKIKVILDDLRHTGATETQLSGLHAPIGLDISAVTTDEIALSIAAQLVSIRRADHRDIVQGPIRISQS